MSIFKVKRKIPSQSGFSLIELMVSLTIFSLVMVVSISTLLTIIDANAKAQALYSSMTNLSFAVDSMSRNTRTAYDHYCGSYANVSGANLPAGNRDCNGGDGIVFTRERDGSRVGYRWDSNKMTIEQKIAGVANDAWLPITSSTTKITVFEVTVDGSTGGDDRQTNVTILINGYVVNGLDTSTDFVLQTNVTQRILNY